MADAPKLLGTDTLRQAYPKFNQAIDNANEALGTANAANAKSDDTQQQLNNIVINNGQSDAEVLQARGTYAVLNDRLNDTDAQLVENEKKRNYKGFGEIALPADFVPKLPFSIYRDFDGRIKHTFDFLQFENYATVLYCDSASGNDSTGNGTQTTPYKSLKKCLEVAVSHASADILIRVKGNQYREEVASNVNKVTATFTNKKISIIPDGNSKIVCMQAQTSERQTGSAAPLVWTADGTAWKTSRSTSYNVFDLKNRDYKGVSKPLEYVSSVALVQATANSWYTDGSTVWVNTFDGRQPDKDILVGLTLPTININLVNSTLYVRDFEFYAGFESGHASVTAYGALTVTGDATSKFIGNKCIFAGGEARTPATTPSCNGMQILETKEIYLFNCTSAYTRRDGFNYHYYTVSAAERRKYLVFEFECIAYDNGRYDANSNNNATTAHEGVSTLRVFPIGYNTKGPVLADVNGCYSIIYDGSMRDSKVDVAFDTSAGYYFDNVNASETGKAILINSEGGSPKYALSGEVGFNVQVRNFAGVKIKPDLAISYVS